MSRKPLKKRELRFGARSSLDQLTSSDAALILLLEDSTKLGAFTNYYSLILSKVC